MTVTICWVFCVVLTIIITFTLDMRLHLVLQAMSNAFGVKVLAGHA